MLSVEEARQRMLDTIPILPSESGKFLSVLAMFSQRRCVLRRISRHLTIQQWMGSRFAQRM
jgi:hypothetical protein